MFLLGRLRSATKAFRRELKVYQLVLKDDRVPKPAKWLLGFAVAYTLSPIDLIPDFIPVLGYLDDLVIVPALLYLALKMIPPGVVEDCRRQIRESSV